MVVSVSPPFSSSSFVLGVSGMALDAALLGRKLHVPLENDVVL